MPALKNAKEERFVQCLIEGLSQRKAYKAAYPNSEKWKDATVDARACELFKQSKILVRYEELQKLSEDKAIMTSKERKKWLTSVIMSLAEETKDKLKAIDILNKMSGDYIEKLEIKGSVEVNNPFNGLSTEELKKLIKE